MEISERMQTSLQKEYIPQISREDFLHPDFGLSPGTRSHHMLPFSFFPLNKGCTSPTLEWEAALVKSDAQTLSYLETANELCVGF